MLNKFITIPFGVLLLSSLNLVNTAPIPVSSAGNGISLVSRSCGAIANCRLGYFPGPLAKKSKSSKKSLARVKRQDDGSDDSDFDSGSDDSGFDDDSGSVDDSGSSDDSGSFDDSDFGSSDDSGSGSVDDSNDGGFDSSNDVGDASGSVDDGSNSGSFDDGSGNDGTFDDGTGNVDNTADDGTTTDDGTGDDTTVDDGTTDDSTGDDTTVDDSSTGDDTTTDGSTDDTSATDTSSADDSATSDAATSDDTDNADAADATASTTSDSAAVASATPSSAATDNTGANDQADSNTATCGADPTSVNAATISLIKQFEGFVPKPAPDPIGLPTVGFGHKCTSKGCSEVTSAGFSFPLSQATASQLLANDLGQFVTCVNNAVSSNVKLNDNQVGALSSFAFNLGCGTLQKSTLLKRLNNGEDPNTVAGEEIVKFNKAGGKVLSGLVKRRAAEVALFQTPSNVLAHPC